MGSSTSKTVNGGIELTPENLNAHINRARELYSQALKTQKKFWNLLLSTPSDINQRIPGLADQAVESVTAANDYFLMLVNFYPDSVEVWQLYGEFLRHVKDDMKGSHKCLRKVAQLRPVLFDDIERRIKAEKREDRRKPETDDDKPYTLDIDESLIPDDYMCPVTLELMKIPVTLSDGHTYEKQAIKKWLQKHDTSPLTGLLLPNKKFCPNLVLKKKIDSFVRSVQASKVQAGIKSAQLMMQEGCDSYDDDDKCIDGAGTGEREAYLQDCVDQVA